MNQSATGGNVGGVKHGKTVKRTALVDVAFKGDIFGELGTFGGGRPVEIA